MCGVSRPGPGDMVDDALRKCDKEDGKCLIFPLSFGDGTPCKCQVLAVEYLHVCFPKAPSCPCFLSPPGRCSPSIRELRVSMGLRLLLPCVQLSPRPCSWEHPPHRYTRQHHSDLEVTVTEESLGKYICTCQVQRQNISKLKGASVPYLHFFLLIASNNKWQLVC